MEIGALDDGGVAVGIGALVGGGAAVAAVLGSAVAVGKIGSGVGAGAMIEQAVPSASSVTIVKGIRYRGCTGGCFLG